MNFVPNIHTAKSFTLIKLLTKNKMVENKKYKIVHDREHTHELCAKHSHGQEFHFVQALNKK
jgi:hypothetical protein